MTTDQFLRIFVSHALKRKEDWTTKIKHAKIPSHPKINEIELKYDVLEKRFIGKHEAAASEEAEVPTSAAHRGERDRDQRLRALSPHREQKNMDGKEKAQVRDISKEVKKGIRGNKRSKRHEKVQNIPRK